MTFKTLPMEHRVRTGVRWMDVHYPEWDSQIDLDRLDMMNGTRCILGQVVGDYWVGRRENNLSIDDAEVLGFINDDGTASYTPLTEAWKHVITARRGGATEAG